MLTVPKFFEVALKCSGPRALLHAQPPMPPMSSADAFANLDEFEDERKEIERENAAHIRRMEHERTMRDNAQGSKKATTETSGRTAIATVTCDGITLKLTLKAKLLERPFETALVKPFLGAFNKKRQKDKPDAADVTEKDLDSLVVDGLEVPWPGVETIEKALKLQAASILHDTTRGAKDQQRFVETARAV